MKKKIVFICPTSKTVLVFRQELIKKFQTEGYSVSVIAFDNVYEEQIKQSLGVDFYYVKDSNRGINPFKVFSLKKKYYSIIKRINPDVVFTFMMKPNIFGVRAAKKANVSKIFSMVEGAGDVFIKSGLKWKLIRFFVKKMYRKSFRFSKKVFFINDDDTNEFINLSLVKKEQCETINGIGVNLDYFEFKPIKNSDVFLMVARMLETKGVYEYCQAARIVKQKYPNAIFNYVGEEGSLKVENIKEYIEDGSIIYHGQQDDVRPFLENCTLLVLPSYREGFGLVNAEAGATGRGVITTDTIGTKDTVVDGYNGLFVKVKDFNSLAEKMEYILDNPEKAKELGENNAKFVREHFDRNKINEKLFSVVNK